MALKETGSLQKMFQESVASTRKARQVDGRSEIVTTHDAGYLRRPIRMVYLGAHPDDTALDEGVMPLLVNAGKQITADNQVEKNVGLFVVTATRGDARQHLWLPQEQANHLRVIEDERATAILEADGVANLQYPDGRLHEEEDALTESTRSYLEILDPHVVFVPHWNQEEEHRDHVTMQRVVKNALLENGQKPLVLHVDTRTGEGVNNPTTIVEIPEYIHKVYIDHFYAHETQTVHLFDPHDFHNVDVVTGRSRKHGQRYGYQYAAQLEQDVSGIFSTDAPEPFFANQGITDVFALQNAA